VNRERIVRPAVVGGLIAALPCLVPCPVALGAPLFAFLGGVVAVLLARGDLRRVSAAVGAEVGLYAGLTAALAFALVEVPYLLAIGIPTVVADAARTVSPRLGETGSEAILLALLVGAMGAVFVAFAALGGLLAGTLVRRDPRAA